MQKASKVESRIILPPSINVSHILSREKSNFTSFDQQLVKLYACLGYKNLYTSILNTNVLLLLIYSNWQYILREIKGQTLLWKTLPLPNSNRDNFVNKIETCSSAASILFTLVVYCIFQYLRDIVTCAL
jgi:hypothetical protein